MANILHLALNWTSNSGIVSPFILEILSQFWKLAPSKCSSDLFIFIYYFLIFELFKCKQTQNLVFELVWRFQQSAIGIFLTEFFFPEKILFLYFLWNDLKSHFKTVASSILKSQTATKKWQCLQRIKNRKYTISHASILS